MSDSENPPSPFLHDGVPISRRRPVATLLAVSPFVALLLYLDDAVGVIGGGLVVLAVFMWHMRTPLASPARLGGRPAYCLGRGGPRHRHDARIMFVALRKGLPLRRVGAPARLWRCRQNTPSAIGAE